MQFIIKIREFPVSTEPNIVKNADGVEVVVAEKDDDHIKIINVDLDYLYDGFDVYTKAGQHCFLPLPGEDFTIELVPRKIFLETNPLNVPKAVKEGQFLKDLEKGSKFSRPTDTDEFHKNELSLPVITGNFENLFKSITKV